VEKDDVILVLGKGAETYMDRASGKEAWDGDDVISDRLLKEFMNK
jgi:UDP-N-acetylmuramyl tripeptide synthase